MGVTRRGTKLNPSKVEIVKSHKPLAKAVKQEIKSLVKNQMKGESKWYVTVGSTSATYNGTLVRLSSVPQSAGASNDTTRIGDALQPTSLQLNYTFYNIGAPGVNPYESDIRVVVFRWLVDDSLSAPTAGLIVNSTGGLSAAISTFNHDQRGNFEVLYDKLHLCSNSTLNPTNKPVRTSIKVNSKMIKYVAGATNGLNNIYLLVIGDSDTAVDPYFGYYAQLNFQDN